MVAVYARIPRAGLGNRLLVWARAALFAELNGLDCYVSGGNPIPLRAWLRGERRSARSGFAFSPSKIDSVRARLGPRGSVLREPPVERRSSPVTDVLFSEVPPWRDYFAGLREHRSEVIELFLARVAPRISRALAAAQKPVIAVHLRRGDFRALRPGEDFRRTGGARTPDEYFVELIGRLRQEAGGPVPVTVFSDGTDSECAAVLALPAVARAPEIGDLGHMLLMAEAKVIIPSAGSTFSMWSAFLSEAATLYHPAHFHAPTRPADVNARAFEGAAPLSHEPIDRLLAVVVAKLANGH